MKVRKDNRYLYIKGLRKEVITIDMFDLLTRDCIPFRVSVLIKALEGYITTDDIKDYFNRAIDYLKLDSIDTDEKGESLIHNFGWYRGIYLRGSFEKRGRRIDMKGINKIIADGLPLFAATACQKDLDDAIIMRRYRKLNGDIMDMMFSAPRWWHYGIIRDPCNETTLIVIWNEHKEKYNEMESILTDMAAEARIERTLFIKDGKPFLNTWKDNRLTTVETVPAANGNELTSYMKYVGGREFENPDNIAIFERYKLSKIEAYKEDPEAIRCFQQILEKHGFDDYMDAEHIEDIDWRALLLPAISTDPIL